MLTQELHVQTEQNKGEIFRKLIETARKMTFTEMDVAVAYATLKGSKLLNEKLEKVIPKWGTIKKRWLVSINGKVTEPEAISYLAGLQNSEVRIPFGKRLINTNFKNTSLFHYKIYFFESSSKEQLSVFSGSPNLTASAFYANCEQAFSLEARPQFSAEEKLTYEMYLDKKRIIRDIFDTTEPLTQSFLNQYMNLPRPSFRPDKDLLNGTIIDAWSAEVPFDKGLALATARNLWVEVRRVIYNHQVGNKGNQLDLQGGTRSFFGFSNKRVAENTTFGHVNLTYLGNPYRGALKYVSNGMDKLNLPPCDYPGPPTYVNETLLFERRIDGAYQLTLGNPAQILNWKQKSENQETSFKMKGGRAFGVFS